MGNALLVVALASTAGGCVWEKNLASRPARLQMGFNSRRVVGAPPKSEPKISGVPRTTTDPGGDSTASVSSTSVTGNMQFTMGYKNGLYLGGEVEAGPMSRQGSFFGGAYGVAGAEMQSPRGSLSVEVIAGRRWVRYELDAGDVASVAFEPRVRGQLWLGPQVSLGGVIGANAVPDEQGWMAGIYLGIYSDEKHGSR